VRRARQENKRKRATTAGLKAPPFPVGGEKPFLVGSKKPFPVGHEKLSIPVLVPLRSAQEAAAHADARPRRWQWAAAAFAAILAAVLGWLWFGPSPQLTVLKIAQITHFGRVNPTSRLQTDGTRINFVERKGGRFTLAAVPIEGGEPAPIPTPFPNTALYGISPDHSELLVGSSISGEEESLWMLPTTGGSPRRLGNVVAHDAAWSRDGQKIAYFSGSGIYVVKPDGTDSRKLGTTQGREALSRWSPDGHVLRFSVMTYPAFALSLAELADSGGGLQGLLPSWRGLPSYYGDGESGGDWTPDGRYFVFRSTRGGFASI